MSRKIHSDTIAARPRRPRSRAFLPYSNPKVQESSYLGHELESMAYATKYHRWILDVFRPYLGKRIVEVGAGSGSFSKLLIEANPERLDAIEPSVNLYPLLSRRLRKADVCGIGYAHRGTLSENTSSIRKAGAPDSVIYVNVLEH